MHDDGLTYLYVDDYRKDVSGSINAHKGYITGMMMPINILYDYNGGTSEEIKVPLNSQRVMAASNYYYTVTGEDSVFAVEPTKSGYIFKGWEDDIDHILHQTGDKVCSLYRSGMTQATRVTLVAQ